MVLTIVLFIIGIIVSIIIAKYFFFKGQHTVSLTPYLQYYGKLFNELDPDLRKRLTVLYNNSKIENLGQAQFLIANTGDSPIRNIIEPLRLKMPKSNRILSVSIIHIQPEGRKISCEIKGTDSSNDVIFNIPLLNKYEFFVAKILFKANLQKKKDEGNFDPLNYEFTITADELPPQLSVQILPYNYYEDEKDTTYNKTAFWIFLFTFILSIGILMSLFACNVNDGSKFIFHFKTFFDSANFDYYSIGVLITAILGIALSIISFLAFLLAEYEFFPNAKAKFKVPLKLKKGCDYIYKILEDIT